MPRPKATHVLSQLADLEQQLKSAEPNQTRDDGDKARATEGSLPSMRTPRAKAPTVPNLKLDALREPYPPSNLPAGASPRKTGRGVFRKYEYSSAPGTLERGEAGDDLPSAEGTHDTSLPFVTSSRSDDSLIPANCSGLDRDTLLKIGVPNAILSRVLKLLSAYVMGFNGLVRDIVAGQPEGEQPALVAVIWQSLLGAVEDNFQVHYSSKLGSITQMWLEQHSTLQDELSGVSQNLDGVYSQNVLLQETIIQTRNALEQEKGAKQYALRLREHADRMVAKSRKDMVKQQEEVEQMKLVIDDLMMLPGKNAELQRQLRLLQVIFCLYMSLSLSPHISRYLPLSPSLSLSISVSISACLSRSLSLSLFPFPSLSLYAYVPVCVYLCLCIPPPPPPPKQPHPTPTHFTLTQRHLVGVMAPPQKKEASFEENAAALEAAKNENMQLAKEMADVKVQLFAEQQSKESNKKYTARLDEHMEDIHRQMRTFHETIKAKEKATEDVQARLRSTQQALQVSEGDRSAMTAKYQTEMKNHQKLSREHERVTAELEHVAVSLRKLREDHKALCKQKEEQEQKLNKKIAEEHDAGARQAEALKSRLGTAMGDKAVVLMKLQSELTVMAKWKDEQKEQKEAALRQMKQMEVDFEAERGRFADKECIIRKGFEIQKREFAAKQLAEIECLHGEIEITAEQHKQELARREEARKKEASMHLHQISSLKRDLKAAGFVQQNTLDKLERAETSLKRTFEELQASKGRMEAKELEFKVGYPPPPPPFLETQEFVMLVCVTFEAWIAV